MLALIFISILSMNSCAMQPGEVTFATDHISKKFGRGIIGPGQQDQEMDSFFRALIVLQKQHLPQFQDNKEFFD